MGVFHIFQIVQMLPNRATHHIHFSDYNILFNYYNPHKSTFGVF